MKKLLLCTTALAGLVAGSAIAEEKVSVTLGASSLFEVGSVSQSRDKKVNLEFSPNQKSTGFWSTSKAYLKAEGKTAEGLVYGAVVRLQTVANSANGVGDTRNDRSHIYVDSDFGSVQLGSNASASKLMQVTSGSIASATGGVDGDWALFTNLTSFKSEALFTGVDTLSNNSSIDGSAESARRVSYFSPRFNGLQLGVSFASDLQNNGGENIVQYDNYGKTEANKTGAKVKNAYSIALNYMNNFNDVDVNFAATYDGGKSTVDQLGGTTAGTAVSASKNNLKTWSMGGSAGYKGFSVAAHYGNNGNSLSLKSISIINEAAQTTPTVTAATYDTISFSGYKSTFWDAGLAYANGPMSASFTYLAGKTKMGTQTIATTNGSALTQGTITLPTIKTTVMSLGADYQVAPGLKPFVEVTRAKVTSNKTASYTDASGYTVTNKSDSNKATVFMLGTQIKF